MHYSQRLNDHQFTRRWPVRTEWPVETRWRDTRLVFTVPCRSGTTPGLSQRKHHLCATLILLAPPLACRGESLDRAPRLPCGRWNALHCLTRAAALSFLEDWPA